jgi:hypothetical protein
MRKIIKGFTYAFSRNIGWQDRTIRSIVGIMALLGAIYFYPSNIIIAMTCGILAAAQAWTVLSARCIICYFAGVCTIGRSERDKLTQSGVAIEG